MCGCADDAPIRSIALPRRRGCGVRRGTDPRPDRRVPVIPTRPRTVTAALIAGLVALAALLVAIRAPTSAQAAGRTVVSLTFDDGIDEQYAAGVILAERGLNATFFVNSARIGAPGFMSMDQLRDLQSDGNEIGGHTLHHARLTDLPPADQRVEI